MISSFGDHTPCMCRLVSSRIINRLTICHIKLLQHILLVQEDGIGFLPRKKWGHGIISCLAWWGGETVLRRPGPSAHLQKTEPREKYRGLGSGYE